MEMLAFVIAVIAPIAYFFGVHHEKNFFQREARYNKAIFVLSFLFGAGVTFLPVTGAQVTNAVCTQQISMSARVLESLTTGGLTAFIALLSFDMGVYQALYLTPILRMPTDAKKKKR
jgi:peptidoglycan/LPS O-acetylase OafA/YrhL